MSLKNSQSQHWAEKKLNTIQSYWDSPPATKRSKWFVEQLKDFEFLSAFEVGFFAGRNLRYIKEAFPKVKLGGAEINPRAVKFAKEKLGLNTLHQGDLHNLDEVDGSEDLVFTSGVLIHVPPENLEGAIEQLMNRAAKYIMHIESIGNNELVAGPKHLKPTYKVSDQLQWAPDLISIYEDMGIRTKIVPLPDDCKTNGASELLIANLMGDNLGL